MTDEAGTSVLRRARPPDADALARLERAAFVGCYAAHRFAAAQLSSHLTRSASFAHVVEGRGRIVAYVLGVQGAGSRAHVARLYSIAVDPSARRRDFARRLLRAFLATARRRGCTVVSLEVAATNRAALALFALHGFAITRRLPAYYSRTTAGLRMRRELIGRADRPPTGHRTRP
ncbi:MAG: GNAT family N-acetyltransferase [Deltaproteobacteria bacterium]|nr:GNAT family N-acetyltransferase [Deltaproteobacteria bacterium]